MPRTALLLPLLAVLAAGCGWRQEPTGDRADRFPVQVADASGAVVEVDAEPQRIVSLSNGATATLKRLGATGEVTTLPANAKAKAVAAANPDLVVVPLELPDAEVARLTTAVHAPIFRFGAAQLDDGPRVVARLGQAVGRGPEGVALAEELRTGIVSTLASAQAQPPVPVFIDSGGFFTGLGPETEIGKLLAELGGTNVLDRSKALRLDELEQLNPAAWAITPTSSTTLSGLASPDSPAAAITAVAEGRVFDVDPADYTLSPDLPRNLQRLSNQLHAPPRPPPSLSTGAGTGTDTVPGTGTDTGPGATTAGANGAE